jgi:hypothetical protein
MDWSYCFSDLIKESSRMTTARLIEKPPMEIKENTLFLDRTL